MKACPLCDLKRKCTCAVDNGHIKKARLLPMCSYCKLRHANRGSCQQAWADPEMLYAIESFFEEIGVEKTDNPIPSAILHAWISNRCVTRKSCDDWSGISTLQRDFQSYQPAEYTPASFRSAIERAGYAIDRGMVSRCVLKEDVSWK
jgi:hypothetical protein